MGTGRDRPIDSRMERRTMKSIYKVHDIVQDILEDVPKTRDDNDALYLEYIMRTNPSASKTDIYEFFTHRAKYGLAKIETVSRCRRKIQKNNPMLRASKKAEDARYEHWKEVREYAQK